MHLHDTRLSNDHIANDLNIFLHTAIPWGALHTFTHALVPTLTHIQTPMHTCVWVTSPWPQTRSHTHKRIVLTYARTYMHTYTLHTPTYTHIHTHTTIHTRTTNFVFWEHQTLYCISSFLTPFSTSFYFFLLVATLDRWIY